MENGFSFVDTGKGEVVATKCLITVEVKDGDSNRFATIDGFVTNSAMDSLMRGMAEAFAGRNAIVKVNEPVMREWGIGDD